MRVVDFVRLLDVDPVPVRIPGFVSAKNKVGGAARVERKQNPLGPAPMLDPQFLHICMLRIADRVHMRTAKGRTQFFKKIH